MDNCKAGKCPLGYVCNRKTRQCKNKQNKKNDTRKIRRNKNKPQLQPQPPPQYKMETYNETVFNTIETEMFILSDDDLRSLGLEIPTKEFNDKIMSLKNNATAAELIILEKQEKEIMEDIARTNVDATWIQKFTGDKKIKMAKARKYLEELYA